MPLNLPHIELPLPKKEEDPAPSQNARIEAAKRNVRRATGNPVRMLINDWFDRLMGAASDRTFAGQDAEYESGLTSRDFMWNTLGFTAWGMVFPLLTIVVTQLVGAERAGMFSLAFVTANLLYIVGNYGVRTYQVSDVDEYHSFTDYQVNRIITCLAMMLIAFLYSLVRGYEGEMFVMMLGICAYKAVDALGDVYEGRLQQVDKLYLGGTSLAIRSLAAFIVFSLFLLITHDLGLASIAMAVAALATLLFVTLPLTLFESPKSSIINLRSIGMLFKECAPVFIALFLYAAIDNLPKFLMEGALTYDNQLYFNALYFPAQMILMIVGLIYKPLLVKIANVWADESKRQKFDLFIVAMMAIIVVITVVAVLLMAWIGIPIMSFLYGIDFEQFRELSYIMLAAGGVTAAIDFLYQIITVLRRQRVVMGLYLIVFALSILILMLMINMVGLKGAVIGYLVVMAILAVLLVREYISQRLKFARASRR